MFASLLMTAGFVWATYEILFLYQQYIQASADSMTATVISSEKNYHWDGSNDYRNSVTYEYSGKPYQASISTDTALAVEQPLELSVYPDQPDQPFIKANGEYYVMRQADYLLMIALAPIEFVFSLLMFMGFFYVLAPE